MERVGFVDSHLHSQFSPDSIMTLEEAVERAQELNLAAIAVTDHVDLKSPPSNYTFYFEPEEQQALIDQLQRESSFKIFKGVEVGLQENNIEESLQFVNSHSFDSIIGALHYVDEEDPFYGHYYKGREEKRAYRRYLELLYNLTTQFEEFDILAHYDFVARYSPYGERIIRYRDFSDIFDALFKYLIENGKALEINTSTYRDREGGATELDHNVLHRYREMGGELITLGSDSHSIERVGERFEPFAHLLKGLGFKYITHFEKRKPYPQLIDKLIDSL